LMLHLRSQFVATAKEIPDILSNTIGMQVTEIQNPQEAKNMLDRFADMYTQHSTPDQRTQHPSFWQRNRFLGHFQIQDDYTDDIERENDEDFIRPSAGGVMRCSTFKGGLVLLDKETGVARVRHARLEERRVSYY
jgi:hypothetical protein